MTENTCGTSDCKRSDPPGLFENPVEGVLDTKMCLAFDQLLFAQIARRCSNWTAIVCRSSLVHIMGASQTKVRNALDRLEAQGFIIVEIRECQCSGEAERYKIIIRPAKLGGR